MGNDPIIRRIRVHTVAWDAQDLGPDDHGFTRVYQPGATYRSGTQVLTIETDGGVTAEYAGYGGPAYGQLGRIAPYLIGKKALAREQIAFDLKRALRGSDRVVMGPVDIALWDIAGKLYDTPLYRLLGGARRPLRCYASTYHGDHNGGLDSPEAFADFAVQCRDLGYPAFKMHSWVNPASSKEAAAVREIRRRVGGEMDLMLDPACQYRTFADALKVGRACDEADFFWYEDPLPDAGSSFQAQRKLRQLIRTPILMGELVRGIESHIDMIVADATDYVRIDPNLDAGITGALKIAHAAEGFGLDVEIHMSGPAHRHPLQEVGIDMGIAATVTTSEGTHHCLPDLDGIDQRIRGLQRAARRKTKHSSNWRKASIRVARLQERQANIRRDWQQKTTTDLSNNHAMVGIEDLQVSNMSRSARGTVETPGTNVAAKRGLNRRILEQGWGYLRWMLTYKARWTGGELIAVPPQDTSQTCAVCGATSADNRRTQARFKCVTCGHTANADVNAAKNVLLRARHARIACGEESPEDPSVKQEPPAATAATSVRNRKSHAHA